MGSTGEGYPATLSADASAAYADGLLRLQRMDGGYAEAFRDAAEADPAACLPHIALALVGAGTAGVDVGGHLRAVPSTAASGNERERSLAHIATTRAAAGQLAVEPVAVRHLRLWPRDVLALSVLVPVMSWSGRPGAIEQLSAVIETVSQRAGSDWWLDALLGFVRQEQCRLDEAAALAERSFAVEPRSGHAAHARAHVHYETGDHAAGQRWLEGWAATLDARSPYAGHLTWHLALHDLAQGDVPAALDRWRRELAPGRPGAAPGFREVIDGGSLLWRLRLRGVVDSDDTDAAAGEPTARIARSLLRAPQAFLQLHVALAAASAGDVALLDELVAGLDQAPPYVHDLLAPVATALAALLAGRPGDAADALARVAPEAGRFGGSRAQRDVIEETYLAALLQAGRADEARALLRLRLDRRPSPADTAILATSLPGHGRPDGRGQPQFSARRGDMDRDHRVP